MFLKVKRFLLVVVILYLITMLAGAYLIRGSSFVAHLTLPVTAPQLIWAARSDPELALSGLNVEGYVQLRANHEIVDHIIDKPLLRGGHPQERPFYYYAAGYSMPSGGPFYRRHFLLFHGRICALDLSSLMPKVGGCRRVFKKSDDLIFCNSNGYCGEPIRIKSQE
jgi:hypothetical protein